VAQNQLIVQLEQQQSQTRQEMEHVSSQFSKNSNALTFNQQCDFAMVAIQRKIDSQNLELASAHEKRDHLLTEYREQEKRLKSWEMLIEQESRKIQSAILLAEIQTADQRYLATQSFGEQR
jgi:flagellar biosynthesis chaperone FliJ